MSDAWQNAELSAGWLLLKGKQDSNWAYGKEFRG